MKRRLWWPLVVETLSALGEIYNPVTRVEASRLGLSAPDWWLMLSAVLFEPDPISAARMSVRSPFLAPAFYQKHLAKLAQIGFLNQLQPGEYRITISGRRGVKRIVQAAYQRMSQLEPLPYADLACLASLLERVVQACLAAPEPASKWSIGYSRRADPGAKAHALVRIDQYLTDLNAFRDDAHLTAWRSYGFSAPAWEVLAYLWRGEAETLGALLERLEPRGHPFTVYQEALGELTRRGWVAEDGGVYRLTEQGCSLRQQAEATTERLFSAPWACLSPVESETLHDLLGQLCAALKKEVPTSQIG